MKKIRVPEEIAKLKAVKAGEEVLLSGTIYTARDQAHKRLVELIGLDVRLPFDLSTAVIYYCGPAGTPPGMAIGSCGPTTSRRMDPFTPLLLSRGLKAMIGKGGRSEEVRKAIKRAGAAYFSAFAGCGALCAGHVISKQLCAFPELGPEAVYRLEVVDFPLTCMIDSAGRAMRNEVPASR